jgi:hypothetical protein
MKNELKSNEASVKNSADIRVLTPEDRHAVWVTDGDERFVVPRRYAAKICAAVPGLRFSFEHIGGKHVGHASKYAEHKEHDDNPERTAEPEELVEKENEGRAGNGA